MKWVDEDIYKFNTTFKLTLTSYFITTLYLGPELDRKVRGIHQNFVNCLRQLSRRPKNWQG
ncbi:Protein of unknown function [Pyronema omphalodes CBS 100304]|uniref:Uncharacterized protein n=1 Tax=Pyronema omphalodes (strain CBS 100304) TaxID=1076935 RepID=U4L5K5_PYROM|nr:Protein of unknown function [Pyronema omphalodes CBS 100304]